MRSIRHSLIVCFLVLLTAALGAVSWSAYRTTAHSLRERQHDAQKMIETQYEARCHAVRADLDRHILRQAQTMANMSRSMFVHNEGMYQIGAIGASLMPQTYFHVPFLMTLGTHFAPSTTPNTPRPQLITYVESGDDLIPAVDRDHGQEYFQTYRRFGQPLQRSRSMGEQWFTLEEERLKKAQLFTEYFDEVELKPVMKVRRVTLKVLVPRTVSMWTPWAYRGMPHSWRPPSMKGSNPKGTKPGPSPRPPGAETVTPTVFIQYASDLAPVEAKIRNLQSERDEQLAEVESTVGQDLRELRSRMLWIGLGTLLALWLGGYVVIRLGLAPLAKMSEAVSRVSPQNFHLALDEAKLPQELRPIAQRLTEVLEQLRNAFAREKQASADISHELRTPLAALMTTLEVGLRKSRSAAEYREILDECRASGQHMYQLVERLLALARLDAGATQFHPAEVDPIEIALQCADLMRPLAKARGLEMRLHLPEPICLRTDPNKLREVLTNLLHNAVEYNKPNGSIELSLERAGGQLRIEVRDTGIGIAPADLEHVFERFYRSDPSRYADTPHAGLGLAIVKSYLDLMGGAIRVSSSDAGTIFTVELPLAEAPLDADRLPRDKAIRAMQSAL